MTVLVTLNLYSGNPNPNWIIGSGGDDKVAYAQRLLELVNDANTIGDEDPDDRQYPLGYYGFTIEGKLDDLPIRWTVYNDRLTFDEQDSNKQRGKISEDNAIEQFLLSTAPQFVVENAVRDYVLFRLDGDSQQEPISNDGPDILTGLKALDFTPQVWNVWPFRQGLNNCYNYATNVINNRIARPGRGSQLCNALASFQDVVDAAESDKLILLSSSESTPPAPPDPRGHLVAMFWGRLSDLAYHWYRQDNDGFWSHKNAGGPATDLDNSGNKITNPVSADRGFIYTEFGGWFVVPHPDSGITIQID